MAKKRPRKDRPEEVEDYEFKEPEFDEVSFLHEEVADTWGAVLLVLSALPAGYISFLVARLLGTGWAGFILAIGWYLGLYWLLGKIKLVLPMNQWKKSLGTGALFLFAWVGFWVLFFNVPFADLTPPAIAEPEVGAWDNGTLFWVDISDREGWSLNGTTNGSYLLNIRAVIGDNTGEEPLITYTLQSRCGSRDAVPTLTVNDTADGWLGSFDVTSLATDTLCQDGYDLIITAVDNKGNEKTRTERILLWP